MPFSDLRAFKLGLIGYPLSHSFSPPIHTAALQSCGLDGDYSLFPIPPEDPLELNDLLSRVRAGEIHGLNVTIPHKQNVIPFLDELTPTAKAIGAVNTIYLRDHTLIGDNTDAPGFLADLKKFLATAPCGEDKSQRHREPKALVFGAGGSARAVVCGLIKEEWNIAISARRPEQAEQLAISFQPPEIQITNYQLSNIDFSNLDLIVNTTPLGMTPNIHASPWPENLPFPKDAAIYDLVYNPLETRLFKDACAQGLRARTGLGMLIEQAALAFELWTGHNPSREMLRSSLQQSLLSTL